MVERKFKITIMGVIDETGRRRVETISAGDAMGISHLFHPIQQLIEADDRPVKGAGDPRRSNPQ